MLFALELAAVTVSLDNTLLLGYPGIAGFCGRWGPFLLRGFVAFSTIFLMSSSLRFPQRIEPAPVSWRMAGAHVTALGVFAFLARMLYGGTSRPDLIGALWLVAGLCAIGFGATALIRLSVWAELARSAGYLWIVALAAALVAAGGGNAMRGLWPRATAVTFFLVQVLLKPFGTFTADATAMTIGSQRFSGEIAEQCSGLEGVGLILSFTTVWLILFRKECRFPQALVLLPAGTVIIFLMNSVRIAALLLIGNAGFAAIAEGGFHSQAGWIVFNLVALGTCFAAGKVDWISKRPPVVHEVNPVTPWVGPLVAILAAGMVSHLLSGTFEWLYPARFVAAIAVLWTFHDTYRALDWTIDWTGPVAGLAVGALWLLLDQSPPIAKEVPLWWIVVRVAAACITVPIAEELAFRGFLYRQFGPVWSGLLVSSVLFGLLHGQRWIAGTLAGLVFGVVMLRKGRLGNAVVAHAVANAIVAIAVLGWRRWDLW